MVCTGSARLSKRNKLLVALRLRPMAWAACSCVRPNSRIRRCNPWASSSGLRSSRCMFSINAMAAAAWLSTARTSTGAACRPARCAALNRRSPAMISYFPALGPSVSLRTRIGCMMPCALMLSASSYSAPSSMRVRGWYMPGTICDSGNSEGVASRDALPPACVAFGPNRASSPRPRPFFLVAIRAIPCQITVMSMFLPRRSVCAAGREMAVGPSPQCLRVQRTEFTAVAAGKIPGHRVVPSRRCVRVRPRHAASAARAESMKPPIPVIPVKAFSRARPFPVQIRQTPCCRAQRGQTPHQAASSWALRPDARCVESRC